MASGKHGTIRTTEKVLVVGDNMSGKNTLLLAFKHKTFIPNYKITNLNPYVADVHVDEKSVSLALVGTSGLELYDHLRPTLYFDTTIVLICFSVDSPASATNVTEKWTPEIRCYCNRCPVIVVACQKDLRTDPLTVARLKKEDTMPISYEVGREIAAQIQADAYMECSAKTGEGVEELFIHAAYLTQRVCSHATVHGKCIIQ